MMPMDEVRRDLGGQWLEKAEEDFGVADLLLTEGTPYLSTAGFHLQQASPIPAANPLMRYRASTRT